MTILGRRKHRIDINNPTWAGGSKTDHWTTLVKAFVIEGMRTVRNSRGEFVRANLTAIFGPDVDVSADSELRFNGNTYPVIGINKLRGSMSSVIKHIEVYA